MTTRSRVIVVLVALVVMLVVSAMNFDIRLWRNHPGPFDCVHTETGVCVGER